MLYKGSIIATGSGKLAGNVFSHNKGGQYIRQFVVPTNPNSPQQAAIRNRVAQLASRWVGILTQAQRDAWVTYAENTPTVNALGDEITLTGLNMYTRANVPRVQAGLPLQNDAPIIFDRGEFTEPTFALDTANQEVDLSFDNTDAWANEDDAAMLLYASRPQNPSVVFFKGPYRFAGKVEGDSVTAPTSPAAIATPFPFSAGQRLHLRVTVSRADGRLSSSFRGFADAS